MRVTVLFILLFLSFAVSSREAPLAFMADDDPAMNNAFIKARDTLDGFLKLAAEKSSELRGFSVKVGVTDGKNTEYFWITDFAESGGRFNGKIGNTPQMVKTVKLDQTYEFVREQIVDWLYIDRPRRKMVGNFTYCALLTKESAAKADAEKKRFNLDCE